MMTQILWLSKRINSRLAISCVLGLSLAATPVALAEYHPPLDQQPPKLPTGTTGTRGGCEVIGGAPLTVLAPQKYVGQTVSTHPTFAWFVPPDSRPFPTKLALYEYGLDGKPQLAQQFELMSSPGVMKLSLPEDKPGLAMHQRYLWQVVISCDPNHPSSDLVARAEIEVVEMPPALKRALSATRDRLEIVDLYARSGLWYDALSVALGPTEEGKLGEVAATLLEDLAKSEAPKQNENLRQIASSERQTNAQGSQ